MKTDFALKEMYEAYREEIEKSLVEEYELTAEEVHQLLRGFELERKFFSNVADFEFLEPSRLANILIERNHEKK